MKRTQIDFEIKYSKGFDIVRIAYWNDESVTYTAVQGEKYQGLGAGITDKTIKELIQAGGVNHGEWTAEF